MLISIQIFDTTNSNKVTYETAIQFNEKSTRSKAEFIEQVRQVITKNLDKEADKLRNNYDK